MLRQVRPSITTAAAIALARLFEVDPISDRGINTIRLEGPVEDSLPYEIRPIPDTR